MEIEEIIKEGKRVLFAEIEKQEKTLGSSEGRIYYDATAQDELALVFENWLRQTLTSDRLSLVEWAEMRKQTSPNELKADVAHNKNERNAMYFNKGYNSALTDIISRLKLK